MESLLLGDVREGAPEHAEVLGEDLYRGVGQPARRARRGYNSPHAFSESVQVDWVCPASGLSALRQAERPVLRTPKRLAPEEDQQVGVDLILMRVEGSTA